MSSRKRKTSSKLHRQELCQACAAWINCSTGGFVVDAAGNTKCYQCYVSRADIIHKPDHKLVEAKRKMTDASIL